MTGTTKFSRRFELPFCNPLNIIATLAMFSYFTIFAMALIELFHYKAMDIEAWFVLVLVVFSVSIVVWFLAIIITRVTRPPDKSIKYHDLHFVPMYLHFFEFLAMGLVSIGLVTSFFKSYNDVEIRAFDHRYDDAFISSPFPYDLRMYQRWQLFMAWIVFSFMFNIFHWVSATIRHKHPKMIKSQPLLSTNNKQ